MTSEPNTSAESLLSASAWLQSVLLGSIATTVAVLAIAIVGLLMLRGRVPLRRGATVVIGCFILFSAGTIASGLAAAIQQSEPIDLTLAAPAPSYTPTAPRPPANDPYAGAAVPTQR